MATIGYRSAVVQLPRRLRTTQYAFAWPACLRYILLPCSAGETDLRAGQHVLAVPHLAACAPIVGDGMTGLVPQSALVGRQPPATPAPIPRLPAPIRPGGLRDNRHHVDHSRLASFAKPRSIQQHHPRHTAPPTASTISRCIATDIHDALTAALAGYHPIRCRCRRRPAGSRPRSPPIHLAVEPGPGSPGGCRRRNSLLRLPRWCRCSRRSSLCRRRCWLADHPDSLVRVGDHQVPGAVRRHVFRRRVRRWRRSAVAEPACGRCPTV